MEHNLAHRCDMHNDPFKCPDRVVVGPDDLNAGGYGIPIHDGGSSYIRFDYCPWCGTNLKTSPLGQVDKATSSPMVKQTSHF